LKLDESLTGIYRVFLDTAPVIYYVENVARYRGVMDAIIARSRAGSLELVTSPITLAECLVYPIRRGNRDLVERFRLVITRGVNTYYAGIDRVAEKAAELRAFRNLTLPDAFQIACALTVECDGFLTNDRELTSVEGLRALILDDLEA
jgi:predicted nucleic acid-binding protein